MDWIKYFKIQILEVGFQIINKVNMYILK